MGRALIELLGDDTRFELVHAVVAPDSAHVGEPVFAAAADSLRYAHDWARAPALDVVIDFSGPAALAAALDHCQAHGIALVSGTTGIDDALEARLGDASHRIAILRAANFSLGVAVLTRLLREAAAALPAWDLEIVETHHGRKQDAPSGTALALGHAAAAARHTTLEASAVYSREGRTGERVDGSIGFAVVRGGDIVGEHTAMLIGQGERLELMHRATDRSIFARGALQAAHWLSGRAPGHWQLDDVIAGG
jgi:4-hydroxy-tetrahydrodipicolinate reductase